MLVRCEVVRIAEEARDVKSFVLRAVDGGLFPAVEPGAHVDVQTPSGPMRPYSICQADADGRTLTIAVKREIQSRGGSQAMHERVVEGDIVAVGAPRNNFALDSGSCEAVLLGAGIGITPLYSMAQRLKVAGRPFVLDYFGRSREEMAFLGVLEAGPLAPHLVSHVGLARDEIVARVAERLNARRDDAELYVCGPAGFMEMVTEQARGLWPDEAVHLERFHAEIPVEAGEDLAFQVHLARTGLTVTVLPGQSISGALSAHGIDVELSCEQGVCGTCVTGLLEGVPDHRDMFLSDAEQAADTQITLCVSRALSPRLVLDL